MSHVARKLVFGVSNQVQVFSSLLRPVLLAQWLECLVREVVFFFLFFFLVGTSTPKGWKVVGS